MIHSMFLYTHCMCYHYINITYIILQLLFQIAFKTPEALLDLKPQTERRAKLVTSDPTNFLLPKGFSLLWWTDLNQLMKTNHPLLPPIRHPPSFISSAKSTSAVTNAPDLSRCGAHLIPWANSSVIILAVLCYMFSASAFASASASTSTSASASLLLRLLLVLFVRRLLPALGCLKDSIEFYCRRKWT